MKLVRVAPLLLIALAPSIPRPIGACSLAPRDGGGWYEEPILGDTGAPTQLVASYSIDRPADDDGSSGLGCMATCGPGPAYVVLQLSATDDLTPANRIGYRFAIVGGQPPQQLQYDQTLTVDSYGQANELGLMFDRDADAFSFDLEITAIDQNGNESTPIVMTIDG